MFATSLQTLEKDRTSMLAAMFSGRIGLARDKVGRYFIDRDGRFFHLILNFLRDGTCQIPRHPSEFQELRREATFFQLNSLLDFLSPGASAAAAAAKAAAAKSRGGREVTSVTPGALRRTALEARRGKVKGNQYDSLRHYILRESMKAARHGRQRWEKTVRIGAPHYENVQSAGSLVVDDLCVEGFKAAFEPHRKGQSYLLSCDLY